MKNRKKPTEARAPLERAVQRFADAVVGQDDAILCGDMESSDKCHAALIAAFEELRSAGDPGRDALKVLFEHSNLGVRATAAAFLLRHCTVEASAVLHEIAEGDSLVAFEAEQALARWSEGTWKLDP